jgi:hypothetical protein
MIIEKNRAASLGELETFSLERMDTDDVEKERTKPPSLKRVVTPENTPPNSDVDSGSHRKRKQKNMDDSDHSIFSGLRRSLSPLRFGHQRKKRPSLKKRVHFAADKNDDVVTEVYECEHPCPDLEELWYTQADITKFRCLAKQEIMWSGGSTYQRMLRKIYDASVSKDAFRLPSDTIAAVRISSTNYRGLEVYFYRCSEHNDNKDTVWAVINAQRILRKMLPFADLQNVLAATSRSFSEPAGRRARLMGTGDAMVANSGISFDRINC